MTTHKRKITVIGHKNPDTDSVCSAIAYAELKNKLTGSDLYVPRRAGGINAETRFVLNYFKTDVPELVEDVGTQVKDIRSAISLNDRILFINMLFNQDPMAFQEALTKINQMTTLDEAVGYIVAERSDWDLGSETVYRFMMAVRRKIR